MKNKKMLIMIISVATLISFIIGFSYAYFTAIVVGNDTASTNSTQLGSLKLNYNGADYINMNNVIPKATDSIIFTVTNSGTLTVSSYQVNFSNVINTYAVKSEMVYTLNCVSSDAVTCLSKAQTEIPSTAGVAINQTSIAPGTTHTYTLTVTFIDTDLPQDYNVEKMLTFKITINEQFDFPTIRANVGDVSFGYYKQNITEVTFEDSINIPGGAHAFWDVSAAQNGSLMAYIIDDGLGSGTYKLFFQTNNAYILANPNSSYLFYYFTKLVTINNLTMVNTLNVTNMQGMFSHCQSLVSFDLSSFDTTNVTDMYYMFGSLAQVVSLDLSNFNTSNVTNMSGMFSHCGKLVDLNISSFDTSKVTDMSSMFIMGDFHGSLVSLDLSNFDTSSVTNMRTMFAYNSGITSLDLSGFDTSSVTDMFGMFGRCKRLINLDLSSFNTGNVTIMGQIFGECYLLTTVDLSSFNTSNVTDMNSMFNNCYDLISADLSSFNTSNVTDMSGIFYNCNNLASVNLSSFNTLNVTDMSYMFAFCNSLSSVNLGSFNTSNVINMYGMFAECNTLTTLNLSNFNTSKTTDMGYIFYGSGNLTSIDIRTADFATVTTNEGMFVDITNGISVIVKDATAKTFIEARLIDAGKTGTVTIA